MGTIEAPELQQLCCNHHAMICWICGIKDRDETPSTSLIQKLNTKHITSLLCCRRLRWYGHVQCAISCIKSITNFILPALKKKEGPGRHVLNVGRLMSISVAVLTLTHFTEMHGEPVFDIAWYCKPHRMGHGPHINLKWIWLDENGMSPQGIIQSCPSQNLTAMLFQ